MLEMSQHTLNPGITMAMASHSPYSQSPQVLRHATPLVNGTVASPSTPVHSPHHSLASSTSSRTPVHILSVHEYRKQQKTLTSEIWATTPAGKTLRRKPAAPLLHGDKRAPSLSRLSRLDSHSARRPLQRSRSAQPLVLDNNPPPRAESPVQDFRPHTTEPFSHSSYQDGIFEATKIRHFNSRKRLPRPPTATRSRHLPSSGTSAPPVRLHQLQLAASSDPQTQRSYSSEARTSSILSLSKFPRPPLLVGPPLFPRSVDVEHTRFHTLSYATRTPVTPPDTPVTIHYRGASFDLVNPHSSLLLHDIVTPSKDFGSSEYLIVPTPDELLAASVEMAPKRPLYGDYNSAHAGIMRRADEFLSMTNFDMPLFPTPAAVSPGSSACTSPMCSPESDLAPSPLAVKKLPVESHFSIKQLTQSLASRLVKDPRKDNTQELQELAKPTKSVSDGYIEPTTFRQLRPSFVATPGSVHRPLSPPSPITPTTPYSPLGSEEIPIRDDEFDVSGQDISGKMDAQELASMVPQEFSFEQGRFEASHSRLTQRLSQQHIGSRPYYEDLDSIYPSSSIYSASEKNRSVYPRSWASDCRSRPPTVHGGLETSYSAHDHRCTTPLDYSYLYSIVSEPVFAHRESKENTDTISKIIDQYDPSGAKDDANVAHSEPEKSDLSPINTLDERPTLGRYVDERPAGAAPLGRPFQYDEQSWGAPGLMSATLPHSSSYSYEDTRNLLQISSDMKPMVPAPMQLLQTSSSYSQTEELCLQTSATRSQVLVVPSPTTPQAALEHAKQIFDDLVPEQRPCTAAIPAMWARRTSSSQIFNKRTNEDFYQPLESDADADCNENDWESVMGLSQGDRRSLDSIANYSSDEDTSDNAEHFPESSLPVWSLQALPQSASIYSHPSPIQVHENPFQSSPPPLHLTPVSQVVGEGQFPPAFSLHCSTLSAPQVARNVHDIAPAILDEQQVLSPWTDPYGLSEKETQELLASGPNDKIMSNHGDVDHKLYRHQQRTESRDTFIHEGRLERENTFEKLCIVGPRGNLTGTPRGTGMNEAGSSIADTSSPGMALNSSCSRGSPTYPGFYATPFSAIGSVTRVDGPQLSNDVEQPRAPSEVTLFPKGGFEGSGRSSVSQHQKRHLSLRCSTTFEKAQHRTGRAAVSGQTKLREMMLSPKATRQNVGSQDTTFSRFMGGSERPSTSDTMTPLQRRANIGVPPCGPPIGTRHYSPHLLCPERATTSEVEHRREKLSWTILAVLCLLPPCIFLYRTWGDVIISLVTKGQITNCTLRSKKMALVVGLTINIALIIAIVVPVVVAVALGVA